MVPEMVGYDKLFSYPNVPQSAILRYHGCSVQLSQPFGMGVKGITTPLPGMPGRLRLPMPPTRGSRLLSLHRKTRLDRVYSKHVSMVSRGSLLAMRVGAAGVLLQRCESLSRRGQKTIFYGQAAWLEWEITPCSCRIYHSIYCTNMLCYVGKIRNGLCITDMIALLFNNRRSM
jgi:hypothetical protein